MDLHIIVMVFTCYGGPEICWDFLCESFGYYKSQLMSTCNLKNRFATFLSVADFLHMAEKAATRKNSAHEKNIN